MFEDIFDLSIVAPQEEIMSFLNLWLMLFVVVFTLRLLQRMLNWIRRKRAQWHERREAKRAKE